MPVLNSIELEGTSPVSWDEAARGAVAEAARTLRQIRRVDVLATGVGTDPSGAVEFLTTIRLYFEVDRS